MAHESSAKFICPTCGDLTVSRVLDTRGHRRRRKCLECGDTFATLEVLAKRGKKPRHRPPSKQVDLVFELK